MATGLNAAVLFTSEKYRYGAWFLIALAIVVVVLQALLIPLWGMNGAAMATCLASFFYNGLLFWFVRKHFGLQPFGRENTLLLLLILVLFSIGYLIPSSGNPLVNILLKGTFVSGLYLGWVYRQNLAPEVFEWMKRNR
jgi:O-antigen/teichoic acid export membrane protein